MDSKAQKIDDTTSASICTTWENQNLIINYGHDNVITIVNKFKSAPCWQEPWFPDSGMTHYPPIGNKQKKASYKKIMEAKVSFKKKMEAKVGTCNF